MNVKMAWLAIFDEQILEIVKIISFGDSPTRIGDVLVTHTYISSASTSIILNP